MKILHKHAYTAKRNTKDCLSIKLVLGKEFGLKHNDRVFALLLSDGSILIDKEEKILINYKKIISRLDKI